MANSKISALTSATTPLAGTETLPVVQGGVTKQVSIANLTAGRAISVLAVNQAGTSAGLQSYFGFTSGLNYIGIGYNGVTYSTLIGYDVTNEFGQIQPVRGVGVYGNLKLCPSGGDVLIGNNLIPSTAAKGINFTANSAAAGKTSQLLNWYEEGIWTATLSDGTNNATMNISTCVYTRIGRQVTVSGLISTTSLGSVSGAIRITGLPFTVGNGNSYFAGGGLAYGDNFAITAGQSVSLLVQNNSTYMSLRVWSATTGNVAMTAAQWTATGAAAFSVTYFV